MDQLIKISSPEQQLRQNRLLLLTTGTIGSVAGLLLWSAAPFVLHNTKDKSQVILRYLSIAGSLAAGVTAVVAGNQLARINPLLRAIDLAEKNDFLTQLAASLYRQQQFWESEAKQPVDQQVIRHQLQKSYESSNAGTPGGLSVAETVTDTVTQNNSIDIDGYKPMFLLIRSLQQQGVSDSEIIKNSLGYQGRNYPEGKKLLDTLIQLGEHQNW